MDSPGRGGRLIVAGLPIAWLLVFFLLPFGLVLKISFSEKVTARPPYSPAFSGEESLATWAGKLASFGLDNYRLLLDEPLYVDAFLTSLRLALTATIVLLIIAYPIAYGMARAPARARPALLLLAMLPFWTSFLIRVYAWIGILKPEGLLNSALLALGVIDEPLEIMNTEWAVQIGLVYCYLPFMLLPLYAALDRIEPALIEAAQDLGAPRWKAFWLVTVPLSMPGVVAGSFLVFIPALGEFVIPDLLGGSDTVMIGSLLWSEFFGNRDWPLASSVAIVLLVVIVGPILAWRNVEARRAEVRS